MADTKISLLTSGTAQGTDVLPAARAGSNFALTASSIAALAPQGTVTSVSGTGTKNGLTLTGTVTGSGNITLGGTFTATASEISDFNSATRAQTEAALVAGSNITITPGSSGATRTLTIAASGGGSGGTFDPIDMYRVAAIIPVPLSAAPTYIGISCNTGSALSTNSLVNSTYAGSSLSVGVETAATANSQNFIQGSYGFVYRGNGTAVGGFVQKFSVSLEATAATGKVFWGMAPSGGWAATDVISNKTDIVGFGFEAGDANFQIFHNDSTGTATKVNLGANFPTSVNTFYEVTFDCTPNGNITYTVNRKDSAFTATGTLSTNLPTGNQSLTVQHWCATGEAVSVAVRHHGCTVYRKNALA